MWYKLTSFFLWLIINYYDQQKVPRSRNAADHVASFPHDPKSLPLLFYPKYFPLLLRQEQQNLRPKPILFFRGSRKWQQRRPAYSCNKEYGLTVQIHERKFQHRPENIEGAYQIREPVGGARAKTVLLDCTQDRNRNQREFNEFLPAHEVKRNRLRRRCYILLFCLCQQGSRNQRWLVSFL